MEVVKYKILLENSVDRSFDSQTWGIMTASTFYVNVFLTQNIDNMGLFTDIEYFSAATINVTPVDYSILTNKLLISGFTFPFMYNTAIPNLVGLTETDILTLRFTSDTESSHYSTMHSVITGMTDSKIEDVRSYDALDYYKPGFNIATETYDNYVGTTISGVTRVVTEGEPSIYVFDTLDDSNIGTNNQNSGLQYIDYTGITRTVDDTVIPVTNFRYIGEGFNETNISLSALTKEEYLFGVVFKPEVKSDVFIDRGVTSVMDFHLRLSEIKNLGELSRYGNGFYNLTKQ